MLETLVARHPTARKAADEALRESERRFRRLAALSNDFFWKTDTEHRYTMLDFGAVHRGQHEKWKKLGKRPWDIPYTSPDEAAWASHRATIAARKSFVDFALSRIDRGEERFRDPENQMAWKNMPASETKSGSLRARENLLHVLLNHNDFVTIR